MRFLMASLIALGIAAGAAPALAHLPDAAAAPMFTTQAAQGGAVSAFSLTEALAKGPVVLYFFPKSFTSGCTAEAHDSPNTSTPTRRSVRRSSASRAIRSQPR